MRSDEHPETESVDLPTPTAWPILCAFGVALIFTGLVTHVFISLIGIISAIFTGIGWFRECFPHPKHVRVPYREPALRVAPVKISPRQVDHLQIGAEGHRLRIPVEVHPLVSGVFGGLAGGAAMAILAMGWGLVLQKSIWYPINLLAAAALPDMSYADYATLSQFHLLAFTVAVLTHLSLSISTGLLYTVLLPMLPPKFEWLWGGIVTPLLWTVLIVAGINVINPALADRVDWPWFVICQVAFGLVGGYVVFKSAKIETMQALPLAQKMGLEAMRKRGPGQNA
jgi:hypothetical protein